MEKRRAEIAEYASQPLLQFVEQHSDVIVADNSLLLLTMCILTHAVGDARAAMLALAKVAAKPFESATSGATHIIEQPAGNMTFKKLIKEDQNRKAAGKGTIFLDYLSN